MNYTIIENVLTEQELALVNNIALGYEYPWFYHYSDTDDSQGFPFMCHTLMHRSATETPVEGTVNSDSYQFFRTIFDRLCPQRTLLRASLNLTFHNAALHGNIHIDHPFEHQNLIIYLTQTDAGTLLFDDNDQLLDRMPANHNTAVQFSGMKHAQEFCSSGQTRVVAVFTYV